VISGNYHKLRHFYFELDHAQTRGLISLFKPAPVPYWSPSGSLQTSTAKEHIVPGQVNSESYPKDFNQFVVSSDSHNMELVDSDGDYASASRTSKCNLDGGSSNWDDLDHAATKEGTDSTNDAVHEEQSDTVAVRQKLQELFVSQHKVFQSSENAAGCTPYKSIPQEAQSSAILPTNVPDSISKGVTSLKDLASLGQCYGNAEVLFSHHPHVEMIWNVWNNDYVLMFDICFILSSCFTSLMGCPRGLEQWRKSWYLFSLLFFRSKSQ
jgi:hypothetical protein